VAVHARFFAFLAITALARMKEQSAYNGVAAIHVNFSAQWWVRSSFETGHNRDAGAGTTPDSRTATNEPEQSRQHIRRCSLSASN
jgi:hypothetical protein